MKYIKQVFIIFGITMAGEVLNATLPLPVSSGAYGLSLMLLGLCAKVIKVSGVEDVGNFLPDTMPTMFIPVPVGLIESYGATKAMLVSLFAVSVISTTTVMVVTGKVMELITRLTWKGGEVQ